MDIILTIIKSIEICLVNAYNYKNDYTVATKYTSGVAEQSYHSIEVTIKHENRNIIAEYKYNKDQLLSLVKNTEESIVINVVIDDIFKQLKPYLNV